MTKTLSLLDYSLPINSLDAFITRVMSIPLLTQEEEFTLARQLREHNDLNAARQLILPHLRFVVRIAKGYNGYGLPLADLIQEGNIGLMKAVKRFDPAIGVRLVSFAVHWIKAEIHEYILRNWRIVKIATTKAQRKLFFKLRSAKKRLGWFTQGEISAVAENFNVKTETVAQMETSLYARDASFDAPLNDTDEETSFNPSSVLANSGDNPELALENGDWQEQHCRALERALQSLDKRSHEILQQRWLNDNKLTLQELAGKYGVSAERIRQIEKEAMQKIKAQINKNIHQDDGYLYTTTPALS